MRMRERGKMDEWVLYFLSVVCEIEVLKHEVIFSSAPTKETKEEEE